MKPRNGRREARRKDLQRSQLRTSGFESYSRADRAPPTPFCCFRFFPATRCPCWRLLLRSLTLFPPSSSTEFVLIRCAAHTCIRSRPTSRAFLFSLSLPLPFLRFNPRARAILSRLFESLSPPTVPDPARSRNHAARSMRRIRARPPRTKNFPALRTMACAAVGAHRDRRRTRPQRRRHPHCAQHLPYAADRTEQPMRE